jgi:hypothetical protein
VVYKILNKIMYLFYFKIFFSCGCGRDLLIRRVLGKVYERLHLDVRKLMLTDNRYIQRN